STSSHGIPAKGGIGQCQESPPLAGRRPTDSKEFDPILYHLKKNIPPNKITQHLSLSLDRTE
ncbi:MAG: hypothetical protein KAW16_01000, partial [candidate division Zixibacteria bacterium]|nr:hypothetical protein [candidate division Zixibacteria bacterium]